MEATDESGRPLSEIFAEREAEFKRVFGRDPLDTEDIYASLRSGVVTLNLFAARESEFQSEFGRPSLPDDDIYQSLVSGVVVKNVNYMQPPPKPGAVFTSPRSPVDILTGGDSVSKKYLIVGVIVIVIIAVWWYNKSK